MKVKGTKRGLFLKTIHKHLFFGFGSRYSIENTIIINDILVKQVLSPYENIILPKSWTFANTGKSFMDTMLPWVV